MTKNKKELSDSLLNVVSKEKCDDCGKESEDVTLEDFYGDGYLINLCNVCSEKRSYEI